MKHFVFRVILRNFGDESYGGPPAVADSLRAAICHDFDLRYRPLFEKEDLEIEFVEVKEE